MISQCLKIDLGSFVNHLESFGYFLNAFFMFSIQNDPKMTPKLVSGKRIPCRWKKMMITIGFLIVWNPWDSEAFVSRGAFDDENFGLKTKKTCHRRTPQNCPKGSPEGKLKESASHHMIHKWSRKSSAFQARAALVIFDSAEVVFGVETWKFLIFEILKNMISQCLKIDLGSFVNHLESCGYFLNAFFMFSIQNDPKMTSKLVSGKRIPCRWKKMVITIGFRMVWNLW